jgi:hypothetical protein
MPRTHLILKDQNEQETVVEAVCPGCSGVERMTVKTASLAMWNRGDLIQDAFPELDASQRERFITGYCDPCFQAMWDYLNDEDGIEDHPEGEDEND